MSAIKNTLFKIRRKLRWKTNDFLVAFGLLKFKQPQKPIQRILVYHGIDEVGNKKVNSRFLSQTIFNQQLEFFKKHFQIVSLEDFYAKKFDPTISTLAITFDDGYSNNLYKALPILEKHKAPATFFITTIRAAGFDLLWADALDLSAFVSDEPFYIYDEKFVKQNKKGYCSAKTGIPLKQSCKNFDFEYHQELIKNLPGLSKVLNDKKFDNYRILLNEDEIKKLGNSPITTIGSHGYYHTCLDRIPLESAKCELKQSKEYLEKILGKKINSLAFPDGRYTPELVHAAIEIGYTKQLSGNEENCKVDDEGLRNRLTINPHISLYNQVQAILKGDYR